MSHQVRNAGEGRLQRGVNHRVVTFLLKTGEGGQRHKSHKTCRAAGGRAGFEVVALRWGKVDGRREKEFPAPLLNPPPPPLESGEPWNTAKVVTSQRALSQVT